MKEIAMKNVTYSASKYSGLENKRPLHILLIGTLPPPIGGATTLFKYLIDDLAKDPRLEIKVVNTSRTKTNPVNINNPLVNIWVLFNIIFKTVVLGRKSDIISLHASDRGKLYLSPIIYIISRILRKQIITRSFGGAFEKKYESQCALLKWLLKKTYFNSEICLFETKFLVNYFRNLPVRRAEWFSNYTSLGSSECESNVNRRERCQKFIFIGWVNKVKGIEIILESGPLLSRGITIDIFGPLYDEYTMESINYRGNNRISYKGILRKDEIEKYLKQYDALVLPTFHPNEGYPSVILEAYAYGLPVITTNWMSIPEIVDKTCGLLIEPHEVYQFANAVNQLSSDVQLFRKLQQGALEKSIHFSSKYWTEKFIQWCIEVVK